MGKVSKSRAFLPLFGPLNRPNRVTNAAIGTIRWGVLALDLVSALVFDGRLCCRVPVFCVPSSSPLPTNSNFVSLNSYYKENNQTNMATATKLSAVVLPPTAKHTATVFILHGLGDTGHGWADVAEMLSGRMPWVKWVLPHAPQIAVTVNGGMRMPAWYDIPR